MKVAIKGLVTAAFLMLAGLFSKSWAQEGISVDEQGFRVFYSVFNSTMITPDVAATYNLIRDEDLAYVNIVVTQIIGESQSLGRPAMLTGTATNLMQQAQPLKFKTIEEQNTVYYLAPVKHGNEEMFHFKLEVKPQESAGTIDLDFSKKLYVEK